MKKIITIIMAFIICGCDGNPINKVKKMNYPKNQDYSNEKVLDNRSLCTKTEWIENKNERTVTYICRLKKGNRFFNFNEEYANNLREKSFEQYLQQIKQRDQEQLSSDIENVKSLEELNTALNQFKEDIKNINIYELMKNIQDKYLETPSAISITMNKLANNNDVMELNNELTSEIGSQLINQFDNGFEVYNDIYNYINNYPQKIIYKHIYEDSINSAIAICERTKGDCSSERDLKIKKLKEIVSKYNSIAYKISSETANSIIIENTENIEKYKNEINKLESTSITKEQEDEAKKQAETQVRNYSMTAILYGEEIMTWKYSKVSDSYILNQAITKQYEYGGTTMSSNLDLDTLLSSSINDENNIDKYMSERQSKSLKRFFNND